MVGFSDVFVPSQSYLSFLYYKHSIFIFFMHLVQQHVFCPLISFITLCVPTVFMFQFNFYTLLMGPFIFFTCLHLYIMFLLNILYSVLFTGTIYRFFFINWLISFVIRFFPSLFFGLISFTDVTRASLKVLNLNSKPLKLLYLLWTANIYLKIES